MARDPNSGPDSFSESDFTDSGSDNDIVEQLNDPSSLKVKVGSFHRRSVGAAPLEPKVGMVFHSEEEAYEFYNEYAKRKGFSVRRGHVARRTDGSIQSRYFLCSKEGCRQKHSADSTRKPRALERTNCMARIEYKVDRENRWVVSRVVLDHNHLLASASTSHMLKSHRKASDKQRRTGDEAGFVGGQAVETVNSFAREGHGVECVSFVRSYHSSCLSGKRMRDLEKGDVQFLFEYLKTKQLEDPSFFYAVLLDEMDRITNFFWADAQCVNNYLCFGDVISVDTTYRLNKSDIPFVPFTGVNHHKQIVVFGAALLLDESIESFVWLFNTFLAAMAGRQPTTIFTEQCVSIANAVSMVLPNTCHRICLWHTFQNAEKKLSSIYSSKPNFSKEFKSCLYEAGSEEDFYAGWNNLVTKYDLAGNPWLQDLFAIREKWALVYQRNLFSATMTTIQWSENMSNLFKVYFNRKLPISRFIELYDKALVELRNKELSEDYKSRNTKPVLLVDMPMLNEAAESYTRLVYMDFEDQFKSQIACICETVGLDGTLYTFKVSLPNENCYWLVELNPTDATVTCSCKKFESMGILCMHALKVLNNNNILNLPPQYILKRWTKFANEGAIEADGQETLPLRYNQLCHKMIAAAAKAFISKDALEVFEHGFDRLIMEVDNVRFGPPKSIESDMDHLNSLTERKKKRRTKGINNSVEANASHDLLQNKDPMMVHDPSHCRTCDAHVTSIRPNGVSGDMCLPPDTVTPSLNNLDTTASSQGVINPNETQNAARSSVGMQIVRAQSDNMNACMVEKYPHVVVYRFHCDKPMRFAVPGQQKHIQRNLNLDINKGN